MTIASRQAKGFFLSFLLLASLFSIRQALALETDPLSGLNGTAEKVDAYKADKSDMGDTADGEPSSGKAKEYLLGRVGSIIGLGLSLVGLIFFALMLYAGFKWMMARGNAAESEKARDLIYDAIIGLVIVSGAYLITRFVGEYVTPT